MMAIKIPKQQPPGRSLNLTWQKLESLWADVPYISCWPPKNNGSGKPCAQRITPGWDLAWILDPIPTRNEVFRQQAEPDTHGPAIRTLSSAQISPLATILLPEQSSYVLQKPASRLCSSIPSRHHQCPHAPKPTPSKLLPCHACHCRLFGASWRHVLSFKKTKKSKNSWKIREKLESVPGGLEIPEILETNLSWVSRSWKYCIPTEHIWEKPWFIAKWIMQNQNPIC